MSPAFQSRLRAAVSGDVRFDRFTRGQYSTDASIYEIEPLGVVIPRSVDDAIAALSLAAEAGVPLLPRGAGTSQCGQTVGEALVIDGSRHLREILEFDAEAQTVWVEPGVVLDHLNQWLRPHGLWFPVDVSTAAQATIGGMTANNSCGARSIRYGNMVHNVLAVDAWLSSGEQVMLGPTTAQADSRTRELIAAVRALYVREADELARRIPAVQRRVAGYNLDLAAADDFNLASLAVGSEGTLGFFRRVQLQLARVPRHKVLGVVHFPTFYDAMNLTQDIVRLDPDAVELVDRTMIDLSRENPAFRATVDAAIRGTPDAVLLVEFAGDDHAALLARLARLNELMADLRLPGSVVDVIDPAAQAAIWNVRKAGLNIMMSMKGDGKPVSFIEDCAVPLEHLAEYTARLNRVFEKHGTRGTWYAHASVGCLHVRPVLDLRTQAGVGQMRAIAEEACALVREYKGAYSGEHGDGLVRSEWIETMYGARLARAYADLKQAFDPAGLMNPGKIVAPPRMDDRELFRFDPDYRTENLATGFDWSAWEVGVHNRGRGFAAAVEMCNNNGHCRKFDAGTMCPSFRVTRQERDLTRGRANALRLALSGQLGPDALTAPAMHATMDLCVGCKGCRRECPTGVDMAKMKQEFLYQYHRVHPRSRFDRVVAHLPRYARWASRFGPLLNLRNHVPGLPWLVEKLLGFAARRALPRWHWQPFRGQAEVRPGTGAEVVLLADTFNRWFEPENLRAALRVLAHAGYQVHIPEPVGERRPLCCGRTYLAAGMLDEARAEAERTLAVLAPYAARGVPIIGLEPSCLFGFRDEIPALVNSPAAAAVAAVVQSFEQFLVREQAAGRLALALRPIATGEALVHGHCHQKAFAAMSDVETVLAMVPGLRTRTIAGSCCGMAGAFGYAAGHYDTSLQMAAADLLPAIEAAPAEALLVADGTSCRHQIQDAGARTAIHVARVLERALS